MYKFFIYWLGENKPPPHHPFLFLVFVKKILGKLVLEIYQTSETAVSIICLQMALKPKVLHIFSRFK
jgi:hypothetical protein